MSYELFGKSKEVPGEVINFKALIFSVSFESLIDRQLVQCEEGKHRKSQASPCSAGVSSTGVDKS